MPMSPSSAAIVSTTTTASTGTIARAPMTPAEVRQITSNAPAVATRRMTGVNHGPRAPMVIAAPTPAVVSEAVRRARILVGEGEAAMGCSFEGAESAEGPDAVSEGGRDRRFQRTHAAI